MDDLYEPCNASSPIPDSIPSKNPKYNHIESKIKVFKL